MAWRSRMSPLTTLVMLSVLSSACAVSTLEPPQFEAAFQGRCGSGSPCEQLCLELHDGTFECGCDAGFVLQVDGYGCQELNTSKSEPADTEDVLYQKDVSFSAELEVLPANKLNKAEVTVSRSVTTTVPPKEDNYLVTGERNKEVDGLSSLLEDGVSKTDLNIITDQKDNGIVQRISEHSKTTTQGPSLEQKVPEATVPPPWTAALERSGSSWDTLCVPGRCNAGSITTPRFLGSSWLALHALRGAYKRVRIHIRVRPERARGVLLLTGEHDDLTGDYLAIVLRQGHVELRFDCGSGAGILRSPEPVRLGRWNTVSVYRHRWDAWLRLNSGKRVRGRSKGLFSRMTFREPVWVGGSGNTSGLLNKLGLEEGLLGCVDYLRINSDTYRLMKDAVSTYEIAECAPTLAPWKPANEVTTSETTSIHRKDNHALYDINDIVHFEDNDIVMRDAKTYKTEDHQLDNSINQFKTNTKVKIPSKTTRDSEKIQLNSKRNIVKNSKYNNSNAKSDEIRQMKMDIKGEEKCECQHGGGCVVGACLCPLGYAGAKCEITLDLKVPRFNGSSYLRLPGLGDSAKSWLEIQITIKPTSGDGLLLYNAEYASGDGNFFSLYLKNYYVEFAFDTGSGITLIRSSSPLTPNTWQRVSVSLTNRHATLRVGTALLAAGSAGGTLALHGPLLVGGAPVPVNRLVGTGFSGCVASLVINNEELSIVSSALGGVNVDNCEEPSNQTCINDICKETLHPIPEYPHKLSPTDIHHTIVGKKGTSYHKNKMKKHQKHTHNDRNKKNYNKKSKKLQDLRSNEILTEGPVYDGQTYMQVKYMTENEINWVDANSYPSFMGRDSFIHIDDEQTMNRLLSPTLDINIRFRSRRANGLLVWSGALPFTEQRDFLSLAVENSVLVFRYNLGSGEVVIIANHTKVDDGLWHRARATRNHQAGVLEVDGLGSVGKMSPGKLKQLNTRNGLFIGGLPSIELNTKGKYKSGLIGCVSQISLSGDFDIPLSLSKLPHTITSNIGRCDP